MPAEYDYVVVGSGAGGGPLACRLARDPARYRVALLDAGNDPAARPDGRENFNYSVPVLHGRATEDALLSWRFFVRHYTDDKRQLQDSKIYPKRGPGQPVPDPASREQGIFYPRAAAIGGCTAHNAMITIYPHNEDWEYLRKLTGDESWSPDKMRGYFERLEDCRYAPLEPNSGRHGFGNWLSTSLLDVKVLFDAAQDRKIQAVALGAVKAVIEDALIRISHGDDSEIRALLASMQTLVDVMQSVAARLPSSKRAEIEKLAKAVAAAGESEFANLKSLLSLHLPELTRLRGPKLARQLHDEARAAAVDALIDRFQKNILGGASFGELVEMLIRHIDPNDWRIVQAGMEGVFAIPLATDGVQRSSPREFIKATQDNCPYRLEVLPDVLVSRIVFEGTRAVGVRYVTGRHQYWASPLSTSKPVPPLGPEQEIRVRREVILAGGAFNTPQLLMLSGVGPEPVLQKWKIPPTGNRFWPGVGKNLQDRYEVTVVSEMQDVFGVLKSCKFDTPQGSGDDDPCFVNWRDRKAGVYTTNGALFGIIKRSTQAEHLVPPAKPGLPPPDLFLFGLLGNFKGYAVGYAAKIEERRDILTWAILKGHTRNRAGDVTLRSTDPRDPPLVNFRNFDDGRAPAGSDADKDAEAVIEGVEFVQRMLDRTGQAVKNTIWPNVPIDDLDDPAQRAALKEFILNETWGHHACGTCQIGNPANDQAVVDGDFRVLGLQGLRVVDASVFPRIPGFFIVTPIYMISEKAADVILRDASRT
jgi:choline dehydrogenase-like flavoprotein